MNKWQVKKLGEVCNVIAGQSPESSFYNNEAQGLPFYQGKKEFREKYISVPTKWTTKITKEAQKGDILMSVRAPVEPINFSTQTICIGRGLAAIRAGQKIDKNFLFYGLLAKQRDIKENEGAVFASINKKQIESIYIPVPPIAEQKRIVEILDEAFEGIAIVEANTQKKLEGLAELKQSVLQKAFLGKLPLATSLNISPKLVQANEPENQKIELNLPTLMIERIKKQAQGNGISMQKQIEDSLLRQLDEN